MATLRGLSNMGSVVYRLAVLEVFSPPGSKAEVANVLERCRRSIIHQVSVWRAEE
jgi:hypothetical protein